MHRTSQSLTGPRCLFSSIFLRRAGIATVLALAIMLWGCAKDAAEPEPVVPVQIINVKKTDFTKTVTAQAVLFPIDQSAITPKISAPVKQFFVKRGSKVKRGQLLAMLENQDLVAAAQDAKGSYEQAQAAYATAIVAGLPQEAPKAELDEQAAKQALDAQQKIYTSRENLFKQGAIARKDLVQAKVDLTNAQNQYKIAASHLQALEQGGNERGLQAAAGELESAKGKYLAAQAQLGYSQIHSPIAGVVTDRPLYPGEMAAAGTPLLTVMDTSKVIARAHIPQADAALLKIGNSATIEAPGLVRAVPGKITVISPALDPNSTTIEVWVQAENPANELKPGTSVTISMVAGSAPQAIVVPSDALLTAQNGSTSVMLAGADGRAHQRSVRVGLQQDNEVQIVSGLQAGDRIVGAGAYGLPDNAKITSENAGDKSGNSEGSK